MTPQQEADAWRILEAKLPAMPYFRNRPRVQAGMRARMAMLQAEAGAEMDGGRA